MEQRICVNCGAEVPPHFTELCNQCWQPWDVRREGVEAELERATASGTEARICANCGAVVRPDFVDVCGECWKPWRIPDQEVVTDLERATQRWTLPLVPRTYQDKDADRRRFTVESKVMIGHGYEPWMQNQNGGHIHVGRLLVTGGWSMLAGQRGIRSKGTLTVTYRLQGADQPPAAVAIDPLEQIRKLGELRDAGLLTADEFEAKKAEFLSRL